MCVRISPIHDTSSSELNCFCTHFTNTLQYPSKLWTIWYAELTKMFTLRAIWYTVIRVSSCIRPSTPVTLLPVVETVCHYTACQDATSTCEHHAPFWHSPACPRFLCHTVTSNKTWVNCFSPARRQPTSKQKFKPMQFMGSTVNGIPGHTRHFPLRVPGPKNNGCIPLLYYTATHEGSHLDESNWPAHKGRNPSQPHDTAWPLTDCVKMQLLKQFCCKSLTHTPHSSYIAPSDFHLCGPMKKHFEVHCGANTELWFLLQGWCTTGKISLMLMIMQINKRCPLFPVLMDIYIQVQHIL